MKIRYYISALVLMATMGSIQASGISTNTNVRNSNSLLQPPPQRTPEERAKRDSEWMKTDLALTEKQIPLVDTLNLKYAKKLTELRKTMEGQDREAFRPKMEELQKQKSEELKAILTEEQMKKYLELLPQRRGGRGQGQGQGGPQQ